MDADRALSGRDRWLFSLVLGHSRHIEARFLPHQDSQTLLRCRVQVFAAIGGVPIEIPHDRMKTAVIGEDEGVGGVPGYEAFGSRHHPHVPPGAERSACHPPACHPH